MEMGRWQGEYRVRGPRSEQAGQLRVLIPLVWRCREQGPEILLVTKSGVCLVVV